jgi:hypothetical protein
MSADVDWPVWSIDERPGDLRRYVVPDAVSPLAQIVGASPAAAIMRLRTAWDRLRQLRIGYVNAQRRSVAGQRIRTPAEVLVAPRAGTCLDVALVAAAALEHAGLATTVVILEPTGMGEAHALVAVRLSGGWEPGAVWERPPEGFAAEVRTDLSDLTAPVVVLDPNGLTVPLPRPINFLGWAIEDAAARGRQILTGGEWRWRLGVVTAGGPADPPRFIPSPKPSVIPLRGIYLEPDEQRDSPLRLLRPEYRVADFQDRDELAILRGICREAVEGTLPRLVVVTGVGGSGKTRLALEAAEHARQAGWYAGPLLEEPPEESMIWLATVTAPLLVIIDYADARTSDVKRLLTTLGNREGPPAVIIATARSASGEWLTDIGDMAISAGILMVEERIGLPQSHPNPPAVFRAAVTGSQSHLPQPDAHPATAHELPSSWTTLDLILLGWLAAQGEDLPETTSALYHRVLRHERAYWSRTYTKMTGGARAPRDLLAEAAVALTLTGPTFAEATEVARRIPLLKGLPDMAYQVVRTLQECLQPGPGERFTLRPDPVGDHQLLTVLAQDPSLLERLLPDGVNEEQLHHAVFVLNRSGQNDERAAIEHLQQLMKKQPQRWKVVMSVAAAVGGAAEQALTEMVSASDPAISVDQLSPAIPSSSVGAWRLGLLVDERRLNSAELAGDPEYHAQVLFDVSNRRYRAGDRAGAISAVNQAVDLYRTLAETNRDTFIPHLASALNNQATLRSAVGDISGALAAIDEAVALKRSLAEKDSTFTPSLAMSLNNQAAFHSQVGDWTGAQAAVDEAVTLRRALIRAHPAALASDLANALSNQAKLRYEVGNRNGALAAIEEATNLWWNLVEANRAAFTPDLAGALTRQAAVRSGVGDNARALNVIEEATGLWRALVEANPAAFKPDLATALDTEVKIRSAAGDRAGALTASNEAVTLRRALAEANPAAFKPDLATALDTEAEVRSAAGDRAGALTASNEAVTLRRALAEANPAAFNPHLAAALIIQANARSSAGDRTGALAAIDEAVNLYRSFAEPNLAAFTADLAVALTTQASRRAEVGDRSGAVAAIDDAVNLYRALAEATPGGFTSDLALALNNQASLRSDVGDGVAAVDAIHEAVTLFRGLTQTNHAAFTPGLAMSLTTQAKLFSEAGDRTAALSASNEAILLYEGLVETNHAAFTPNLATALNNEAKFRSDIGDRTGALAAIDQAVTLRRALAEADPAAFTADLAMSLNTQANLRSDVGDISGALAAGDEAVAHYRTLVRTNPRAFTADLAMSLNTQAYLRSEAGDRAGALVASNEAVTHHRTLAQTNAAFTPHLARALNNQANRRSDVGDRAVALAAIAEATSLWRTLVDANAAAFTPGLAMSLSTEADIRSAVGDHTGALAAIEEATNLNRALAQADPAAFAPDLEVATRTWAELLNTVAADTVWKLSREAVSHPQIRARITAAAALWHHQRGNVTAATSLLRIAAEEAAADLPIPSLAAPPSAISEARQAVRATAEAINPNVDGLPAWATYAIPADQLEMVQDAAEAQDLPAFVTVIRNHAELITKIDFLTTLDTLDMLYPNDVLVTRFRIVYHLIGELGLVEALTQLDREHERQEFIEEWIDIPTWNESFNYLADHFDTLTTDETIDLLMSSEEPVAVQHGVIALLARTGTVDETKSIVTRTDLATQQALNAIENADLERVDLITAANPSTTGEPGTGALLIAVLLAAQGRDPQTAIAQARIEMSETQRKANRYRLDQLTRHAPSELQATFAALRDAVTIAYPETGTESNPSQDS